MIHHSVHVFIVSHLTGEKLRVRIDIPLEKKKWFLKENAFIPMHM